MQFVILAVPYMRRRGEKIGRAGSDPQRFQDLMEEMKIQMQFAESVGYNGFCLTEQHMQVEGIETTTNPLFWDYFIAQHTEKMRVGQLGMNLTAVNPIQLAENLAMLDHFTQGRMFAGFSRGNTPRWTGTFGQHINITSTHSDKSEADQRNRRACMENWKLIKALWTEEVVNLQGEFWQAPPEMDWEFAPTTEWSPASVKDGKLQEIGIVPRPYQQPHPPVYAPFSYSMETAKFWAREGGKMMSMVNEENEHFIPITLDVCLKEAQAHGRNIEADDMLALGGHLIMGRNPAETKDLYEGFEWLFKFAYDAPPYKVPMGRMWMGSHQEVLDHVSRLKETYGVNEYFLWHHVGYFERDQELAMLNEFAEAVIKPMSEPKMKYLSVITVALACLIGCAKPHADTNADTASISFTFEDVRNNKGQIIVGLYANEAAFDNRNNAIAFAMIPAASSGFTVHGMTGSVAALVFHDENSDGELNQENGYPAEGYGSSGTAGRFDSPTFQDSLVHGGDVPIKMYYLN